MHVVAGLLRYDFKIAVILIFPLVVLLNVTNSGAGIALVSDYGFMFV